MAGGRPQPLGPNTHSNPLFSVAEKKLWGEERDRESPRGWKGTEERKGKRLRARAYLVCARNGKTTLSSAWLAQGEDVREESRSRGQESSGGNRATEAAGVESCRSV